nr:cupin domain-containing protein [uncultured Dyadobacter sp.]
MKTMQPQNGFKSSATAENTRAIPGAVFNFLSMGRETEGRQALIRIVVNRGSEPPAHTHSREDESYFIIKGSIRYTIGDQLLTVNEGEFVYLPKDVPHKFEIQTEQAEVLMWLSPAGLDQWFWDNSTPAPDGAALPGPAGPPPAQVIEHFVNSLRDYGVEMS